MNKQEAIEILDGERYAFPTDDVKREYNKALNTAIETINQIDDPEKLVVPQAVADWIEVCKEHLTTSLYTAMNPNFMKENSQSFDLILWIKKTSNQDIFARAWLCGYEVEKEPIYVIRSKGTTNKYGAQQRLCHSGEKGNYFWCGEFLKFKHKFTYEELEQSVFGWVFDCEGVEVQEVE